MADGLSKSRFKLPSRARWFEKKGMGPLSLHAGQYSLLPFLSLLPFFVSFLIYRSVVDGWNLSFSESPVCSRVSQLATLE